jgi:stage III sporulation protein SpoIIIAA
MAAAASSLNNQAKELVHSVHAFKLKDITNRPTLRLA